MLTKETLTDRRAKLLETQQAIIQRMEQLRKVLDEAATALIQHDGALQIVDELLGLVEPTGDGAG